jgi:hypothetical protein
MGIDNFDVFYSDIIKGYGKNLHGLGQLNPISQFWHYHHKTK